jgi:hypothetical protein
MQGKNHILAAINVAASAGNILLIYLVYGAGSATVAYFLSTNIIAAANLLLLTFFEQFPYFYMRKRSVSPKEAEQFFSSVLILSFLIVVPSSILLYSIPETITQIFSSKLKHPELEEAAAVLKKFSLTLLSTTPLNLFQQRLNCLQKIQFSYIISLIPTLWLTMVLIVARHHKLELVCVINLFAFGGIVPLIIGVFHGLGSYCCPTMNESKSILEMVKQSAKIRTAHNIHNFVSIYIINNAASATPSNLASIFFGVKRAIDALVQVSIGPFIRSFPAILTDQILKSMHDSINQKIQKHTKAVCLIYGVTMFVGFIIAMATSSFWSLSHQELLYSIFSITALMGYGLTMSIEIPFSMVCSAYGKSLSFYIANTAFISILSIAFWVLIQSKRYEALPVGIFAGQIIILLINRVAARAMLLGRA